MITRVLRTSLFAATLGLLAATSALAQTDAAPAPSAPAVSAAPTAPADSVKALHRLFSSRRTGSTLLGLPGGYMFGYGAVATARGIDGAPVTLGIGTVLSAVSISKGIRFSRDREAEIVADYQQGKPLPKAVRRRLHKKHFRG